MSKKIANSELEVMRILWREQRLMTFTEIRKELASKMNWSKSTIQTLVTRLRDKGYIEADAQDVILYSAKITEQGYLQMEEQDFLDRLFDGSAVNFVTALCRNRKVDEDDIATIKAFLEMGEDKK
jgi:predicted transcriptional regulator